MTFTPRPQRTAKRLGPQAGASKRFGNIALRPPTLKRSGTGVHAARVLSSSGRTALRTISFAT